MAVTAGLHRLCHGRGPCLAALGDKLNAGAGFHGRIEHGAPAPLTPGAFAAEHRERAPDHRVRVTGQPAALLCTGAGVGILGTGGAGFVRSCAVSGSQRSGAGGSALLRRTGALVGALRGAGGSNRSSCTGVGGHGRRLRAGRRVGANGRAPRRVSLRTPTTIRTTARAISQATTISTSGKSATLGGLGRLRGGAWPLVRRQFALQALQRASHAVLDSVAGDHAGGAAVAIRSGVDAAAQLGT